MVPLGGAPLCPCPRRSGQTPDSVPTRSSAGWARAALARSTAAAHARGIVHRDVKPENVLFAGPESPPLLADLGLAKHFRADAPGASGTVRLSATGEMRGTIGYLAPEQMRDAKEAGPPADVFALG